MSESRSRKMKRRAERCGGWAAPAWEVVLQHVGGLIAAKQRGLNQQVCKRTSMVPVEIVFVEVAKLWECEGNLLVQRVR